MIFFKDNESRFKIIQRLKQELKASPNTMGYISSKVQELLKNRFLDEKTLILICDRIGHLLKESVHFDRKYEICHSTLN